MPSSSIKDLKQSPLWLTVAWGAWFLTLMELFWLVQDRSVTADFELAVGIYVSGLIVVIFAVFVLLVLPAWWLGAQAEKLVGRRWFPWLIYAAIFGLSWQNTLVQGDGIRAHPHFELIALGLQVLAPASLALFSWFVLLSRRFPLVLRRAVAALALLAGVLFQINLFEDYLGFHGHLAVFNGVLFIWLAQPLGRHLITRRVTLAATIVCLAVAAVFAGERDAIFRHIQRYSMVPNAMIVSVPMAQQLMRSANATFTYDHEWTWEQERAFHRQFEHRLREINDDNEVRGQNVLLVVLETVRWDYWADPKLTPRFHQWKRHGLYIPEAVAQYPATPLAYGAMFTSQPPTVLGLSPFWSRHRLFDEVAPNFDQLILSKPDNEWFEHTAITDFFIAPETPVNRHKSSPAALGHLRKSLEALDDGESFFSWVHLYEPHSPYKFRPKFERGGKTKRIKAYRSEIAYVDEHLGNFMDWFFEQPMAQDTLVIVVADHGEGMGEVIFGRKFNGHHVHVNNVVSRVPMFFAGPGLPRGKTDRQLVTAQMDIMPTVYDFLGTHLSLGLYPQGDSLYELLATRPQRALVTEAFSIRGKDFFDFVHEVSQGDSPEAMFEKYRQISIEGEGYAPKIGLQYGDEKIIYDRVLERYWLYDIVADPYERVDLAQDEPERLEIMKSRLEDWTVLQSWVATQLNALP
ncbi:MAG: sulfatase-like hydrolase/transferase [Bradymonadaceae bacterium]|nr:sulfatase-like hydrolase/transferase [Lujinxingiaceae bacterium]